MDHGPWTKFMDHGPTWWAVGPSGQQARGERCSSTTLGRAAVTFTPLCGAAFVLFSVLSLLLLLTPGNLFSRVLRSFGVDERSSVTPGRLWRFVPTLPWNTCNPNDCPPSGDLGHLGLSRAVPGPTVTNMARVTQDRPNPRAQEVGVTPSP